MTVGTQAPPPAPDPDLDHYINTIISESGSQSARGAADLSLAMVALVKQVAEEQARLKDNSSLAVIAEMPAMKAVVTNAQLFQVLLAMLGNAQQTEGDVKQGRKRSPSEDNTFNARKKQMLATPSSNRPQIYSARQTSHSQLTGVNVSAGASDSTSHQVFAATVLYSVLQHMDHWPIQLMSKYAEDMFGSRTWVDNELCHDLVSNLEMSLNPNALNEHVDEATSLIADEVENYFTSLSSQVQKSDGVGHSTSIRASLSSQQRTPSAKEIRVQSRLAESTDESSSSGEEEILESNSMEIDLVAPTDVLKRLFKQSSRSNQRVRLRYVGHNLDLAYECISDALEFRLGSKSKQNSRLLQALPRFLCIPRIRCLSSRHLDRWLQSPALAALARSLLAQMTKSLTRADPPLPDDVEVVDNLLKMKLKPNQFPLHVESITSISATIPTHDVAKQIFAHCLAGETSDEDVTMNPNHNHLEMLRSVYATLDSVLAAKSLAAAVLELVSLSPAQSHSKNLRLVVHTLGEQFDVFTFTEYIIESKTGMSTSISNANEAARLIFDCAMLVGFSNVDSDVMHNMLSLRKAILRWCVTDLGTAYYKRIVQEETSHCSNTYDGNGAVRQGPGSADFKSYLHPGSLENNGPMHKFVTAVQCLLFSSTQLSAFIGRDFDSEETECIEFCSQYTHCIDDDMLMVVIGCSCLTSTTAVALVESLVFGCSKSTDIPINSRAIWKMYELTEYVPEIRSKANQEDLQLPRLANSGLWWRVTAIALAACGLSSDVGKTMWDDHPTVRCLIKMTTSQKYRFPTSDLEESEKELVRIQDAKVKEREAQIAEALFATEKVADNAKPVAQRAPEHRQGLRSSARQKEKRDRVFALEQERIAQARHAEQMKLRRQIKILSKSIMVLEPAQYQRKPPKQSIDLILSINDHFNLAERFRSILAPDFLLQTIGDGRSAIERAYDWLIPIISQDSDVIHRLQPSSTCFLLLKAYGAGADAKELIALSAPLLSHVHKSLDGQYGERHSVLALELLLTDIADESAERRRCARKVLQKAVPNEYGLCGWLLQLIDCPNAKVMVPLAVEYLSKALSYERGMVLALYVLSLHRYVTFCAEHALHHKIEFVPKMCQLVSSRPHVCTDAMLVNSELEVLILNELTRAFDNAMNETGQKENDTSEDIAVALDIPVLDGSAKNVTLPACLLKAAVVVVSNWQSGASDDECKSNTIEKRIGLNAENSSFERLLWYIIPPTDDKASQKASGLASAVYSDDAPAASIEDWISLARAKSCIVAKHAALSAPDVFLPRLLLSCGMASSSFSTMLRRIDEIGQSSVDTNKAFRGLLSSAAISQWGITKIGNRRLIKKKLLGRILAYTRTDEETHHTLQSSFVSWLMTECASAEKTKESAPAPSHKDGTSFVKRFGLKDADVNYTPFADSDGVSWSGEVMSTNANVHFDPSPTACITMEFIQACIRNEKYDVLEKSLNNINESLLAGNDSTILVMLKLYPSLKDDKSFVRILLKWIPVLLRTCEDSYIWHTIFVDVVGKYSVPYNDCLTIINCCAMQWPHESILNGQKWIAAQKAAQVRAGHLSMKLALRFLMLSFERPVNMKLSEDNMGCLIDLSLECFELENQESRELQLRPSNPIFERNVLPDWLAFLVSIAAPNPDLIISQILDRIEEKPQFISAYQAVILRLYTLHPFTATLTETRLKTALLEGTRGNSKTWLDCRCPLDKQIKAMVSNLVTLPHKNVLQAAIQLAGQHPLLFMRHLDTIREGLVRDGSGRDSSGQPLMKRGRIQGKTPELVAAIEERAVKVSVAHWGYSFSEPVWSCVLDLLLSIPAEVLFGVGVELGLPEVIYTYSKLFGVHINELCEEANISQLHAKFNRLASSFMNCNPEQYLAIMQKDLLAQRQVHDT